jgi:GT2 family glycosyltransferase
MPRCSIIIPVHGKASLTQQCLNSLLPPLAGREDVETIVVNDASPDATADVLASYGDQIRVVTHAANAGFSATCNDGAAVAAGQYLVFLNNDTIPLPGWLDTLVRYADAHPEAAVVGTKMLYPNNTIQHAGVVICQDRNPRHIYTGFPADHPAVNKSRRFQIVTAGCALFRRQAFEETGGFDTAFFNGYEDVDLCLRLGEKGYEIHYCHDSVLYHLESVSTDDLVNRWEESKQNYLLCRSRWANRVQPDDFNYYAEDGLLGVQYRSLYPLEVHLSPQLALVDGKGREWEADRLLQARAAQVAELMRENTRLQVRAQEAELQGGPNSQNGAAMSPRREVKVEPRLLCEGAAHWLSQESSGRLISVLLPVKNGAAKLREVLPRILNQRSRDNVEILAVDSGSTDDTIEVLRQHSATILSIRPEEFNHGLTRNLLAEYAQGDALVFVNQTTVPADEHWLANLVAPLGADPLIAGVCSRVLPRPGDDPLVRRDVLRNPNASGQRSVCGITDWDEYRALPHHQLRLFLNFHSLSLAVRPEVFRRIPFRKMPMGEDLLWAKEVVEAGYKLQHEPSSVVLHSHRYSYLETLRINFDDGRANREIVGRVVEDREVMPWTASMIRDDWLYLEQECGLSLEELEYWRITAALRRAAQGLGQWAGANYDPATGDPLSLLSLVERLKAGAKAEAEGAWEF